MTLQRAGTAHKPTAIFEEGRSQPRKRCMKSSSSSEPLEIKIAHSPDSDDAFMFYGLATSKIRVPGLKFTHVLCDIETLNHRAMEEAYFEVTAISIHA